MAEIELHRLKAMVETAADLTQEARQASERDRDYYDDHQWTAEELAILQRRKQPVITVNRIKRKVDAMIGLEQRMRIDPKAFPRNPQDEEAAEAATKALVYVDDNTRLDHKRSAVFENAVIEGYGGVEIVVEQKRDRLEIVINRLRWEEIFFDPYSREKDFSDASYIGSQKWMTIDRAMEALRPAWGGDDDDLLQLLQSSLTSIYDGDTYDDRPLGRDGFQWGDRKHKRVRVAQMYYRNGGQWYLSIFTGAGEIYNEVSPYLDEDGNTCCPIELMTAYVDRDNRRYGVVRSMISQQDEINKRRSKLLHMLNSRQTLGVKGAVDSVAGLKRELASPDGHVELNIEQFEAAASAGIRPFDFLPQTDQVAGQFSLLQESKGEIDMFGPNPSLIGQTQGDASGRAIMAQQQAGMAELAPLYDQLRDWNIRVYRAMWARIRQFWTEERWIRVMDGVGRQEWVAFNQPAPGPGVIDMQTGQPMPQMQNVPAEMDMDIIIEDVPDHITLQTEQFQQLSEMAQQGIPIPPEMIVKASSIKDKAEILEMIEQQRAQEMQAQQQAMQAQMQLEGMKVQAAAQRDMAGAAKDAASAEKIRAETVETAADTEKTRVETLRLARGY